MQQKIKQTIFMKNLLTLFFLIAITLTANAQENNPTRVETVEEIRNFFKDHYTEIDSPIGYFPLSRSYKFDINDTFITIRYESWDGSAISPSINYKDQLLQFDLKDIKKIFILSGKTKKGCSYQIYFETFSEEKSIQIIDGKTNRTSFPLYAPGVMECNSDLKEEGILVAFQHLLKLSETSKK